MNIPLITIGLPVYNDSKHIRETLNSLRSQTYKHIEIIISDNCSSDNTFTLCQQFVKNDSRIKIFRQTKNYGPADNFNFVLKKAKGKYFTWAAGDDLRDVACIKNMYNLFYKNPNCVLGISAMRMFDDNQEKYVYPLFPEYSSSYDALKIFLHHMEYSSLMVHGMYRTKMLQKSKGFHKDKRLVFNGASEFITAYRILLQGDLGYINKPLLSKRDSGYYLSSKKILQSRTISADFLVKIWRYLKFPSFYWFDFYYGAHYIFKSTLPLGQKIVIFKYCLDNLIIQFKTFFSTIMSGLYYLLKGK